MQAQNPQKVKKIGVFLKVNVMPQKALLIASRLQAKGYKRLSENC